MTQRRRYRPMLLKNKKIRHVSDLPSAQHWRFEPKLDGHRTIVYKDKGVVELFSRHGANVTQKYPTVAEGIKSLKVASCVLDGELIAQDNDGFPSLHLLNSRQGVLVYYAFDLLELRGKPLVHEPWHARRAKLQTIFEKPHSAVVQMVDASEDGVELLAVMAHNRLEGIVAKRMEAKYLEGRTCDSYLKIKISYKGA